MGQISVEKSPNTGSDLSGNQHMAADTISGYIQGLLDGIEFKQTAYALDRASRKAALSRFLLSAIGEEEALDRLAA